MKRFGGSSWRCGHLLKLHSFKLQILIGTSVSLEPIPRRSQTCTQSSKLQSAAKRVEILTQLMSAWGVSLDLLLLNFRLMVYHGAAMYEYPQLSKYWHFVVVGKRLHVFFILSPENQKLWSIFNRTLLELLVCFTFEILAALKTTKTWVDIQYIV